MGLFSKGETFSREDYDKANKEADKLNTGHDELKGDTELLPTYVIDALIENKRESVSHLYPNDSSDRKEYYVIKVLDNEYAVLSGGPKGEEAENPNYEPTVKVYDISNIPNNPNLNLKEYEGSCVKLTRDKGFIEAGGSGER